MKISRTLHLGAPLTSVFFTAAEAKELRERVPSQNDRYSIRRVGMEYQILPSRSAPIIRPTNSENVYHLRQSTMASDNEKVVIDDILKTDPNIPLLYKAIPTKFEYVKVAKLKDGKDNYILMLAPEWDKVKPYTVNERKAEEERRKLVLLRERMKEKEDATVNKTANVVTDTDPDTASMEVITALQLLDELRQRYSLKFFITPEGKIGARRVQVTEYNV